MTNSVEIINQQINSVEIVDAENYSIAINDVTPFSIEVSLSGTGQDGLSAYQIAQNNGFTGTEAEWLASLGGGGSSNAEKIAGYDVAITNPTSGNVLRFNSNTWINSPPEELTDGGNF